MIVAGAQDYLANGLVPPKRVEKATKGYREEEAAVGRFITECCTTGSRLTPWATASGLYNAWKGQCIANGEDQARRSFSLHLSELRDDQGERRFPLDKKRTGRVRLGLRLRGDGKGGGRLVRRRRHAHLVQPCEIRAGVTLVTLGHSFLPLCACACG
jgi:phage/plasmid-associated DNA primase